MTRSLMLQITYWGFRGNVFVISIARMTLAALLFSLGQMWKTIEHNYNKYRIQDNRFSQINEP